MVKLSLIVSFASKARLRQCLAITCKDMKASKHAYYVKICYGNDICRRTDLSNNAKWMDLVLQMSCVIISSIKGFHFDADVSGELLFVVKEKQQWSNKTIGQSNVKIAEMVHKNRYPFNYTLSVVVIYSEQLTFMLRTRNGLQFNTQISIQCHFIAAENGWLHLMRFESDGSLVGRKQQH